MRETVHINDFHLNAEEQFFVDHKKKLLSDYAGRFVAIRNGEIAADASTRRELEAILARKFGQPVYAMVKRVTKKAFEFGPEGPVVLG